MTLELQLNETLVDANDALVGAIATRAADGGRFLVPALLPCGECARCRRALTALCPRATRVPADATGPIELPERFITPLDGFDPPLTAAEALAALPLASVLDAAGRIGVGAGDVTVCVGAGALAAAAATSFAARGARSFWLARATSAPVAGVTVLSPDDPADAWRTSLQPIDAGATAHASGGWSERKVFLFASDPASVAAALAVLDDGGGALAVVQAPASLELRPAELPLARVLVHRGAHPDFLPEALAAIRRGDVAPGTLVGAGGTERRFRLVP